MWCIPPKRNAAFVARMEQVPGVYSRPCDARRPVVCMDEQPFQLLPETRALLPARPGKEEIADYRYVREGHCTVWMFAEPLAGWRDVPVTGRRTAVDWAERVRALVDDPRHAAAERITPVCDNLNTHGFGSLYAAFDPAEAKRIMDRLELVFTPKHGSWLNIAECELSALTRQSLSGRLGSEADVAAQAAPWACDRNSRQIGVDWQFSAEDARVKLRRLYPKIKT